MKKHFITGVVILLPLAVTIAILAFIVNFLTNPFIGVVQGVLERWGPLDGGFLIFSEEQVLRHGSQMLILALLVLFTVLLGFLTRWFFINKLISFGDYLLHRIPFINKLYKTSKDMIQTIFKGNTNAFKQVVLIPFPNPHIHSLGLVTREAPPECSKVLNDEMISVFVPTTPNPTSGYLLMMKKRDIIYLDMKIEDAIKFIISCGVMHPEHFHTIPDEQIAPDQTQIVTERE